MTSLEALLLRVRLHAAGIVGLSIACLAGYKTRYLLLESGERLTRGGVLFDDAFFYTTLARNFVKLGFLSLDGETPTNGVQPLWQAILIAVHWLVPSWELVKVSVVVSWLLYVAFCGLTSAWLCRVCASRAVLPVAIAGSIALVSAPFFGAVLRGLETPLFLCTFSLWLWGQELVRSRRDGGTAREWHYAAFGLVCALLFLARTDWFLASVASFIWLWVFNRPYAERRLQLPAVRILAAFALPLVAIVLPYVVHNWLVHGHPMPISGRVKLHYMKVALPTLKQYLESEEWRGAFALLQQVFRLPSKGMTIGVGTWALWGTALGVGVVAFRKLTWARLGLATVFAHWAFMQFAYRELRPYTHYYFAVEILTVCALLGALANVLVAQVRTSKSRALLVAGVALVFAGAWVATDRAKNVKPTPRWDTRLQLARDLKKLPESAKIGAFWPGVFAYYSNRSVFPLDGIIGSQNYFESVVKREQEIEYAQKHGIAYIVAEFPLKDLKGRRKPRSSKWDKSARHRLWAACRYLRSTRYTRGRWSVVELSKKPVAPDSQCPGRR